MAVDSLVSHSASCIVGRVPEVATCDCQGTLTCVQRAPTKPAFLDKGPGKEQQSKMESFPIMTTLIQPNTMKKTTAPLQAPSTKTKWVGSLHFQPCPHPEHPCTPPGGVVSDEAK